MENCDVIIFIVRKLNFYLGNFGSKTRTVGGLFLLNLLQNHRRWEAFFRNYGSKIRTWRDLFHDWLTHLVLHVLCFSRVHPHSPTRLVLHVLYFTKMRLNALILHVLWVSPVINFNLHFPFKNCCRRSKKFHTH